jgi:hypothetical protein
MQAVAHVIAVLAIAGAVVSWGVGAWFYVQTLRAISDVTDGRGLMLRAIFSWMFVAGRLRGEAVEHSTRVNKAIVAFLVCLTVAIVAISQGPILRGCPARA